MGAWGTGAWGNFSTRPASKPLADQVRLINASRTEIPSNQIRALLSNKESRRVGVRAQVVLSTMDQLTGSKDEVSSTYRTNAQVNTLQVLGTVDVESGINNTALLSWLHSYIVRLIRLSINARGDKTAHTTSAETVPCSLNVICTPVSVKLLCLSLWVMITRDPIVNGLIILGRVLDTVMNLLGIVFFSWFVPSTHMQSDSETIGKNALGSPQINVMANSRRIGMEMWVMRSQFTTEGCTNQREYRQDDYSVTTYHPSVWQLHASPCNSIW